MGTPSHAGKVAAGSSCRTMAPASMTASYPPPATGSAMPRVDIDSVITDADEQTLRANGCAAFPKAVAGGHHLINRRTETAVYLETGPRSDNDNCSYPDINLLWDPRAGYTKRDGTPYPKPPSKT